MTKTSRHHAARPANWFEALEPRQLRSGDVPGGGHDVHLSLDSNGQVIRTVSTEMNERKPLPQFQWYDSTPFSNLAAHSSAFESVLTDNYGIWPQLPNGAGAIKGPVASESGVRSLARGVADSGGHLIVIDNETWHFDIRLYSREQVDKTIADMKQLVGWIRDERPQLKVGIYGYMSQSDDYAATIWSGAIQQLGQTDSWYANNMPQFADRVAGWQATSDYLRPLAESVDYMFPALYTGMTDMDSWALVAKNTIEDSRRYGKPVIPFIWPYYHEAIGAPLALTEIPTADWQRELDVVSQYADGAVIWDSKPVVGNEAWATATLAKAAQMQPQGQSLGAMFAPPTAPATGSVSLFSQLPLDERDHHDDFITL